jgi:phage tail-like protein
MNANGQRFWMLADAADWQHDDATAYDPERRVLSLARRRLDASFAADSTAAEAASLSLPHTLDDAGARYWIEGDRLMVLGIGDATTPQVLRSGVGNVTDLAVCDAALFAMLEAGALRLIDLAGRWEDVRLSDPAFAPTRLAPAPAGGAWLLDRAQRRLARLVGAPRSPDPVVYAATTVRPCTENPDPPRLVVLSGDICAADASPVALACNRLGQVAILIWRADGGCTLARRDANGKALPTLILDGLVHAHALAWLDDTRLAFMVAGAREAPVYCVSEDRGQRTEDGLPGSLDPDGDFYPLRSHAGGPFVNALLPRAHFMATPESGVLAPESQRVKPLTRLSAPAYVAAGHAHNRHALDASTPGHVWHRLYLEAEIPDSCGVRVLLAANDSAIAPADTDAAWYEHRFGTHYATARVPDLAHAAWVPQPSELPHHPGLLHCPRIPQRAGLFTVLIQRPGTRVRALAGRYLHVRVMLEGNGRTSPTVAALRAWGARFSYVDHYLPELYRESLTGPERDAAGFATGADFLERSLGNAEGVLTLLEDRIAQTHVLTDPASAPDNALPWLGSWIGLAFDPAWPAARRRDLLRITPELYRTHGTQRGLEIALDAATGGAVAGGGIVVLEDFRLRRLAATILGADLADEHDPLFDGLVASGNSIVGDTLFLGDAERVELAALFAPETDKPDTLSREAAVLAFYDQLAHRATVLVQADVDPPTLGLIRRVAENLSPAHVEVQVQRVSTPLIVGLAALVGIDTRLQQKPGLPLARLEVTAMGYSRVARGLTVGRPNDAPIADAGPRRQVELGASFVLSGARSRAGPGRRIASYRWTWQT